MSLFTRIRSRVWNAVGGTRINGIHDATAQLQHIAWQNNQLLKAIRNEQRFGPLSPPDEISKTPVAQATVPVQMLPEEREVLRALVFALKPRRALEIGTCEGGSAAIIVESMNRNGVGKLICVDPEPRVAAEHWAILSQRAQLVAQSSPECLPQAQIYAGAPFDFVLIDGDHSFDGALRDIEGCKPFLAPGATILLHDAHFSEVKRAIDVACQSHDITSFGLLSTALSPDESNQNISWGGIWMLKYTPEGARSSRVAEQVKVLAE